MDYQMEESSRLAKPPPQKNRGQNYEFGDDEYSTDSGCSSGGSTGSAERLPRQSGGDGLRDHGRSPSRSHNYFNRLRGQSTVSWTHERLSQRANSNDRARTMCSKSCSQEKHRPHSCGESPLHSQSASDTQSSDSETSHQMNTFNSLCKVFQGLKVSKGEISEKKHTKKSPKRILRAPVSYTYVRGLSGLPTQRVPRSSQQSSLSCSCHERCIY